MCGKFGSLVSFSASFGFFLYLAEAGLKLEKNPPASAILKYGIKACSKTSKASKSFVVVLMYIVILPTCISVYYLHAWCPRKPKGVRYPRTGVTDDRETPCVYAGFSALTAELSLLQTAQDSLYVKTANKQTKNQKQTKKKTPQQQKGVATLTSGDSRDKRQEDHKVLSQTHKKPRIVTLTPVMPEPGKERQEDEEVKGHLDYIGSFRSTQIP